MTMKSTSPFREEKRKALVVVPGLPPSLWSAYGRRRNGGLFLTDKAADWKIAAAIEARRAFKGPPLSGRIGVEVTFRVKSRGKWDADNRLKVTLDAMTEARVWEDDRLIDSLRVAVVAGHKANETEVRAWET